MKKTLLFKSIALGLFMLLGIGVVNAQVFMTELADPNNLTALPGTRYIELYNAGGVAVDFTEGTGWHIDKYTNASATVSQTLSLTGSIPAGGYYIVATGTDDGEFFTVYGVTADQFDGADNDVAGSNGDDNLELYNGSDVLIDQFGVPGEDGTGTTHEFTDGRAERVATVTTGNATWDLAEWTIDSDVPSGDGAQDAPAGFDPGEWIGATTIDAIEVTFNVDLNGVTGFVAGTDLVYISGTIAGWTEPGDAAYEMTDTDSDLIYTITLLLDEPGNVDYKYFINAGWNTWGEWIGDPNRSATIEETTTLNDVFGNYIYNVAITEAAPYYAGDVVNITWSSIGVVDVSIYAMMGIEPVGELFTNTPSDGAEEFTIPADAFGVDLYLRVSSLTDSAFVFANGTAFDVIGLPTIYEIQSNTEDGDLSVYDGAKVKISGIVTAVAGSNFWIQMPAGASDYPQWSGIFGYDATLAAAVVIGDDITVEATIEEYYNATEIVDVTSFTINSQGNFLGSTLVSALDAVEPYESTLISMENAEVMTVPNTYGEFTINDGTAEYLVDDKIFAYDATVGDILFITGVTSYSYGSFVLYPRAAWDIFVSALEVDDLSARAMSIYPNPSNGKFFVQMGSAFKANTKVEVYNVIGMKVFETLTNDFKTEINLSAMKQGVYFVKVDDGANIYTQKVIKQ